MTADHVERACRPAPEVLLLLLRVTGLASSKRYGRVLAQHEGRDVSLGARWMFCSATVNGEDPPSLLVSARVPPGLAGAVLQRLVLEVDDERRPLAPESLDAALCESAGFGAAVRPEFDALTRARMQRFLSAVPSAHRIELTPQLAANLAVLRDALRDRLPSTTPTPGPCAVWLEDVTAIDDYAFWLSGWVHDASPEEVRFTAVSPEGARSYLPVGSVTYIERPAIARALEDDAVVSTRGYHAYVELEQPSRHPEGWVMEFRTVDGRAVEHTAYRPMRHDAEIIRGRVMREIGSEAWDEAVIEHQVLPALERLRNVDAARIDQVFDYGPIPGEAEVSIVVAVERLDLLEHQVLQFARDPELAEAELIYVAWADDIDELCELTDGLHELHGLPFRLAVLSRAATRVQALNLGARLARAPSLILMSIGVQPDVPGWLKAIRTFNADFASIGALGPKLVHDDGSIAHAGATYVHRRPDRWQRTLPLAGLARTVGAAHSPRQVDAVSDACLMIDAELFRTCGGYSELYLGAGGDEAGDLSLRLAAMGRENWYVPSAELYLLETNERRPPPSVDARFNDWLFKHRWGARLALSATDDTAARAPTPRLPAIPALGSGQLGEPIESLEVIPSELEGTAVLAGAISLPEVDFERMPYAATYSLAFTGWATPRDEGVVTIEVRHLGETICRGLADLPQPDAKERHPDTPGAAPSGFRFVLSSLGLPVSFELTVDAVTAEGTRAELGRIRGRRRPLRSAYRPSLQPLLVTTLGRTGSVWLVALLSRHPEIIALPPFQYEGMLANYWMEVLQTLASPTSYMQSILPELYDGHWWIGDQRQLPLPLRTDAPEMPRWLGSDHVEILAGVCQSRLDGFYQELARQRGTGQAHYFAEKCTPGPAQRSIFELYPGAREIVLVRDFRDWICSILDFNARRGFELWGRNKSDTDEEWFRHLRAEAATLLTSWRERHDRAHLVRYEDLVMKPESALRAVFSYLGVDDAPGTARRTVVQAQEHMPHAQDRHRTSPTFEASVGRWKRELSPERQAACAEAFDDILVEFGYEPTYDGPPPSDPADQGSAA